jgi:hypothetical protein
LKASDDHQVLANIVITGCIIIKHLLDHLVVAIQVYEAKQIVRNPRRLWGQQIATSGAYQTNDRTPRVEEGEWPPHSGQSR